MNNIFDKELFIKISKFIKNIIMQNIQLSNYYVNSIYIYNTINICRDKKEEIEFLNNIINIVKENNLEYSNTLIYLVVLYLYYALVLIEQNENYLYINDIKYIKKELYDDAINLFFEIAISDKEYCSKIRKLFFMFE